MLVTSAFPATSSFRVSVLPGVDLFDVDDRRRW